MQAIIQKFNISIKQDDIFLVINLLTIPVKQIYLLSIGTQRGRDGRF